MLCANNKNIKLTENRTAVGAVPLSEGQAEDEAQREEEYGAENTEAREVVLEHPNSDVENNCFNFVIYTSFNCKSYFQEQNSNRDDNFFNYKNTTVFLVVFFYRLLYSKKVG